MATNGGRPVVLVVDDEPAIRLLCRVNLELEGYEVREAGSLAAARAALAAGDVAVVLLDVHIGFEDGVELLEELVGAEPPRPGVAVVSGSTDVRLAEYRRADTVLAKPFTIEELTATVRALASR